MAYETTARSTCACVRALKPAGGFIKPCSLQGVNKHFVFRPADRTIIAVVVPLSPSKSSPSCDDT